MAATSQSPSRCVCQVLLSIVWYLPTDVPSRQVSGNGRIPEKATQPGSGLETTFESLNIFLVSAETKTNLTVSSGLSLLTKETGSVRHLDYVIPSCVRTGKYNVRTI